MEVNNKLIFKLMKKHNKEFDKKLEELKTLAKDKARERLYLEKSAELTGFQKSFELIEKELKTIIEEDKREKEILKNSLEK